MLRIQVLELYVCDHWIKVINLCSLLDSEIPDGISLTWAYIGKMFLLFINPLTD